MMMRGSWPGRSWKGRGPVRLQPQRHHTTAMQFLRPWIGFVMTVLPRYSTESCSPYVQGGLFQQLLPPPPHCLLRDGYLPQQTGDTSGVHPGPTVGHQHRLPRHAARHTLHLDGRLTRHATSRTCLSGQAGDTSRIRVDMSRHATSSSCTGFVSARWHRHNRIRISSVYKMRVEILLITMYPQPASGSPSPPHLDVAQHGHRLLRHLRVHGCTDHTHATQATVCCRHQYAYRYTRGQPNAMCLSHPAPPTLGKR